MPLQPYPIYDMKSGLTLAKKPWISPQDSWREIVNGYAFRGRIVKRKGYTAFADLGYPIAAEAMGDGNAKGTSGAPYTDILANSPVLPAKGTYIVKIEDTTAHNGAGKWVYDDGLGVLHCDLEAPTAVGTITYATGAITVNGLTDVFDSNVTVDYEWRDTSKGPVMGIATLFPSDGTSQLLAMDLTKLWEYNTTDARFDIFTTVEDIWSGSDDDFIWAEQLIDQLIIVNGIDPVLAYDGTNLIEVNIDITNSGANTSPDPEAAGWPSVGGGYVRSVDSARMCFYHKNRLILLYTAETGASKPQRARWSGVATGPLLAIYASGFPWLAEDFTDAPTTDWIVSAKVLNDDLIVFFERSTWRLSWTNDFRQPFIWERLAHVEGRGGSAAAKMSTVGFTDKLLSIGATQVTATDGRDVYKADNAIPDIMLDFQPSSQKYSFGVIASEQRLTIWTVTPVGGTLPTRMLVNAYEDGGWSLWELPAHVLGYHEFSGMSSWDSFTASFDATTRSFDDRSLLGGFPSVLMGDVSSQIWQLFDGEQDNGQPHTFRMRSQRWNPFTGTQRTGAGRARFGQLDLIVLPADSETLTVRFYSDFSTTAYLTKTLDLTPDSSDSDKIRRRILVNRSALFHEVELEHSGSKPFAVEAVIPWFAPDGEARQLG